VTFTVRDRVRERLGRVEIPTVERCAGVPENWVDERELDELRSEGGRPKLEK
jgi:hypothetical protein